MPRQYTHMIQVEDEILRLTEEGYTHREVAERLGFTYEQVKSFIKRAHKRQREIVSGNPPKAIGRPRKRPITTEEELRKENKRLRMENELLRDFLFETERM